MRLPVRKASLLMLCGLSIFLYPACTGSPQNKTAAATTFVSSAITVPPQAALNTVTAPASTDAATIIARTEVPILCYHQIRSYKPTDGKVGRTYIVPEIAFEQQMKSLADSGYHSVLPDDVHDYLTTGKALPSKPVMITFDDTRLDQYTAALPALNKYGFKGAFFIMTVSLGRPGYMCKEQVKSLSDAGHTVGSHTWDHKNIKTFTEEDWAIQITKPSKQIENITGKKVEYFAYPFGLWNKEAIAKLKEHGFKSVFQLAAKRDDKDPLYSVRRIIVPGEWSGSTLLRCMKNSF